MENQNQTALAVVDPALVKTVEATGVAPAVAEMIVSSFAEYLTSAAPLIQQGDAIKVQSVEQKPLMKEARTIRLKLREIRIMAEKTKKDLKEDSNRYGKAVQSAYNLIEARLQHTEEHLQKQENYEAEIIKQQQEELRKQREDAISNEDLINFFTQGQDLGKILEADFQDLLSIARQRKAKAEQDFIEQQNLKAENERLRKIAEESEARERAERQARENAEREANRLAEENAAKEAALQAAKQREAYAAEAATDFEKIKDIQDRIKAFPLPECQSDFGIKLTKQVRFLLDKVVTHIEDNKNQLS